MDQPMWQDSGAVALAGTLPILAQSKKVHGLLSEKWGTERLESALAMMRAGKLEGALGDEIHDFLADEIENEADTSWSGSTETDDNSYPIGIKEYEGVYFVWALEHDNVGYFLDIEAAKSYVHFNWWNIREEVE